MQHRSARRARSRRGLCRPSLCAFPPRPRSRPGDTGSVTGPAPPTRRPHGRGARLGAALQQAWQTARGPKASGAAARDGPLALRHRSASARAAVRIPRRGPAALLKVRICRTLRRIPAPGTRGGPPIASPGPPGLVSTRTPPAGPPAPTRALRPAESSGGAAPGQRRGGCGGAAASLGRFRRLAGADARTPPSSRPRSSRPSRRAGKCGSGRGTRPRYGRLMDAWVGG